MNKKVYQQPRLHIVNLQIQHLLQSASEGRTITSNTDLHGEGEGGTITGSTGTGRSRQYDCWGEEEVEE